MPDGMHRNVTLATGERLIQKYTGPSKTFSEPGWDAADNWQDVLTLKPGQVALDFAQPTADVAVSAMADGTGVALTVAGTHFVIPAAALEAAIPALTAAVAKAKANKAAQGPDQAPGGP